VTRKAKFGVRVGVLVGGGEAELEEEECGGAEGEAGDARLGIPRRDIRWSLTQSRGGSLGRHVLKARGGKRIGREAVEKGKKGESLP
jgi:hypothetical protein